MPVRGPPFIRQGLVQQNPGTMNACLYAGVYGEARLMIIFFPYLQSGWGDCGFVSLDPEQAICEQQQLRVGIVRRKISILFLVWLHREQPNPALTPRARFAPALTPGKVSFCFS